MTRVRDINQDKVRLDTKDLFKIMGFIIIWTAFLVAGAVTYYYSLDKRITIIENNIVGKEKFTDKTNNIEGTLIRIEGKLELLQQDLRNRK